jgi:hypothetical protein
VGSADLFLGVDAGDIAFVAACRRRLAGYLREIEL